jgi:hypothetical protein
MTNCSRHLPQLCYRPTHDSKARSHAANGSKQRCVFEVEYLPNEADVLRLYLSKEYRFFILFSCTVPKHLCAGYHLKITEMKKKNLHSLNQDRV